MRSNWTGRHVDAAYRFLVSILWLSFVLSGLYWIGEQFDWMHQQARDADRKAGLESEAAIGRRLEKHELSEMEEIARRRLAREISPARAAPVIFILCVGVLAFLRRQHLDTTAIIACIEVATGDERFGTPAAACGLFRGVGGITV